MVMGESDCIDFFCVQSDVDVGLDIEFEFEVEVDVIESLESSESVFSDDGLDVSDDEGSGFDFGFDDSDGVF